MYTLYAYTVYAVYAPYLVYTVYALYAGYAGYGPYAGYTLYTGYAMYHMKGSLYPVYTGTPVDCVVLRGWAMYIVGLGSLYSSFGWPFLVFWGTLKVLGWCQRGGACTPVYAYKVYGNLRLWYANLRLCVRQN